MTRWRRLALLPAIALLAASGLLIACGEDSERRSSPGGELRVVATHPILGDIVRNVVGDQATVEVIIPAGADPHEFQPSAKQVEAISRADLVVANGFDFEVGLLDALRATEETGTPVFEMASAFTPPAPRQRDDEHDDDEHDDDEHDDEHDDDEHDDDEHDDDEHDDDADPHIWLDPAQMAGAVESLGGALQAIDSSGSWEERAASYAAAVRATDAEVEQILSAVPPERRKLVTNHEALAYFAARYGFEVVGTAIPSRSTAAESSAADLAALAEAIDANQVPAVFADVSAPDDLARALADEAQLEVQVVQLLTETLAAPGEEGDDYLGLLQVDARRIAEALT
jgi:zinc/manganese transport system substrate-binding protein